jgi:DsbC/DsbD-like thiol-disulfide interchange protein
VLPVLLAAHLCVFGHEAGAAGIASEWVEGHNVRSRLVIGTGEVSIGSWPAKKPIVAGLEMQLGDGWKTYWRTPGDAGGVPPEFDFTGSSNVAQSTVLYPAPQRFTDAAGSTIGYKKHVVFPVIVTPEKSDQAAKIKLQLAFGVCREICVPSEASYEVTVPVDAKLETPEALRQAIERVPKVASGASALPLLVKSQASLEGAVSKLTMHINFPKGIAGADVFVEGPPDEFVPLPKQIGKVDDKTLIFEIDLSKGADVAALRGKALKATIVSDNAQSEQVFVLE